jgi:hypothetical protein
VKTGDAKKRRPTRAPRNPNAASQAGGGASSRHSMGMDRSTEFTGPLPPGPPRPRTRPKSRAWAARGGRARELPHREPRGTPCTGFAASRARRCPRPRTPCSHVAASRARRCSSPRTPCTGFAASRARRCPSPRTPCSCIASSRARICSSPGTPCTGFAASRARRSESPRTPCTGFAASRARRSESPRTPCTWVAASRARRSLFPGTPCRSTLPASCRARTYCRLSAPRPSADAFRGPGAWRNSRSVVTHAPAAALRDVASQSFGTFRRVLTRIGAAKC